MNLYDKIMLRKRSVIETVNDELKNVCQIEHTRHQSIDNFTTHLESSQENLTDPILSRSLVKTLYRHSYCLSASLGSR